MTEQDYPETLELACEGDPNDIVAITCSDKDVLLSVPGSETMFLSPESVAQAHAWLGAFLGLPQPTPEHPPVFASNVPFEDIQAGDTVRRTRKGGGITCIRTGIAHHLEVTDSWYTEEGNFIASPGDVATFDILARPAKPQLPTEPGSVVLVDIDGQDHVLRLNKAGYWVFYLNGYARNQTSEELANLPWRLGKVVEA